MRPHDGRIEHDPVQFGGLQGLEGPLPNPFGRHAPEALAHGVEFAEAFGQVGPRATGAHYPHDRVEKQAVVFARYPAIRGFTRQKGTHRQPLSIANRMSSHK